MEEKLTKLERVEGRKVERVENRKKNAASPENPGPGENQKPPSP